jgi:hypothetical protein
MKLLQHKTEIINAGTGLFLYITGVIKDILSMVGITANDRFVDAIFQIATMAIITVVSFFLTKFLKWIWPERKKK